MSDNNWNKTWDSRDKNKTNVFAESAIQFLKDKNVKTVLDLGAGLGNDSNLFYENGYDVTAFDFSEKALEKIKKTNPNIKTVLGDISKLEFTKNSFDVIYAHLSVHYFSNEITNKIFSDIYEILKPGGYFFVKCKSVKDFLYGKGEKIDEDIYEFKHVRHFFSFDYLKEKLHKFKIIEIKESRSKYAIYTSNFVEAIVMKPY